MMAQSLWGCGDQRSIGR